MTTTTRRYDRGHLDDQPRIHVHTPYRIPAAVPIETALLDALNHTPRK